MSNAVEYVKRAAVEAVKAGKPVEILIGEVVSTAPLQIQIEQRKTLGAAALVVPKSLTNHKVSVTSEPDTGNETTRIYRINNALSVGDGVILLRKQGGKNYLVLDRLGG